jgi:hypothetical protein
MKAPGIQIEMFPRFFEDVPEYSEKIRAWEYWKEWQRLPEDQKGSLIGPIRERYGTKNEGTARGISQLINAKFGFPITEPSPKNDVVYYKNIEQIYEYCKTVLGKDGELLPSRERRRVA